MFEVLTPYPLGSVPSGIATCDAGDDRIQLTITRVCAQGHWVDRETGAHFTILRADCGMGCRCSASAQWAPRCTC